MAVLNLPRTVRLAPAQTPIRWTDDPVTTETAIKAVHVNELRRVIDARRRQLGLPAFNWTDDPVIARYTVFKAVHFLELHAALQEAWTLAGRGQLPGWTYGSPPSTERVVMASDVNDLRACACMTTRTLGDH
jgi:hypothetical protein